MDVVMLPLVDHAESVATAIEQMEKHRRAGVIVRRRNDTHSLVYAGDLFRARDADVSSLGKVPKAQKVLVLDTTRAKRFKLDIVRPLLSPAGYEKMFRQEGVDYSMVGASLDTAMIVTVSEEMTSMLMAGRFRCTGTPRHYFPWPAVAPGDDCPDYPDCSVAKGIPKIVPA